MRFIVIIIIIVVTFVLIILARTRACATCSFTVVSLAFVVSAMTGAAMWCRRQGKDDGSRCDLQTRPCACHSSPHAHTHTHPYFFSGRKKQYRSLACPHPYSNTVSLFKEPVKKALFYLLRSLFHRTLVEPCILSSTSLEPL